MFSSQHVRFNSCHPIPNTFQTVNASAIPVSRVATVAHAAPAQPESIRRAQGLQHAHLRPPAPHAQQAVLQKHRAFVILAPSVQLVDPAHLVWRGNTKLGRADLARHALRTRTPQPEVQAKANVFAMSDIAALHLPVWHVQSEPTRIHPVNDEIIQRRAR